MSRSTKRKRTVLLQSWLTPEEAATVQAMAAEAGVSVSALLRSAVFKYRLPRTNAETKALVKLSGEIGKIGSNVNQYALRLNILQNSPEPRLMDAIDATLRELLEWRTAVMQALGAERKRKPPK